MTKRKRRHPGVTLMKPEPERRIGWRARFVDPDTGRTKKESLDPALRTREQREDWAVRKSKALVRRRMQLEDGATRATGVPLKDAIERYFRGHPQLREATRVSYRAAADLLLDWAKGARVRTCDDLTRPKLMAFRETRIQAPRKGSEGPRRPATINRELRSIRVVLGYLCDLDLFAHLSHDDLRRALKRLPAPVDQVDYLKPKDLKRLLNAALRHDAETFSETREEHRGDAKPGSTARYEPIAPFVMLVLLTGMRFTEALELDWAEVDLGALDERGKAVGEIAVTSASKTHRARTIDLGVSPALRKLLASMQLQAGGDGSVFPMSSDVVRRAQRRLVGTYGAPAFGWQMLRRTCGTYLTNAPGIFGAASAFRSARQLGHSVAVAEKHYLGLVKGIPRDAATLEHAMQLRKELHRVVAAVSRPRADRTRVG